MQYTMLSFIFQLEHVKELLLIFVGFCEGVGTETSGFLV